MVGDCAAAKISRRAFIRTGGAGVCSLLAGGAGLLSAGCAIEDFRVPVDPGQSPGGLSNAEMDLDLSLRATYRQAAILPGSPTQVAAYEATVLKGDPASVSPVPGSYLGPVIRVHKGQSVRVRLRNELRQPTIVHWHGLHVPAEMDGHPRFAIGQGHEFVYEFKVTDRAGTYWFHPHPDGRTGPQVYAGLAGLFLVSDDEELVAGLPGGPYDVPLVIQDRIFDADNQLVYSTGGGMMMGSDGFLGNRVLVNGQASYVLPVATRAYRLRLLNGSNSRVYKLAWSDGQPMQVIGTDGGLLEAPVQRDYVMLGPAERVELWADFSDRPVGAEVALRSLSFSGADLGMMMGMGGAGGPPNGTPMDVMLVRVQREEHETLTLPERLSTIARYRIEDAVNAGSPRRLTASMGAMMQWQLNGRVFEMDRVASNEIVRLDTVETWDLVNEPGMMEMVHPIHVHGVQFQIIERDVLPGRQAAWETVRQGHVDDGWKDTVLLMPGERVRIILRFSDYAGLYLYHCHNLEHEDQGMMRNYLVEA